jgi:hypothetical protein
MHDQVKDDEMGRGCSTDRGKEGYVRGLVGKPEGRRPLGRRRRRREDNIKMNLREIGWCDMDWIHLAQDRNHWRTLVNTVIIFWGGKLLSS